MRVFMVVMLFHIVAASRQASLSGREETYLPSRYVRDKVKFGKRWEVYIQAITYDVLHSSFYRQGLSNYEPPKTLLDVNANLKALSMDKHPCRKAMVIMRGRQSDGKLFVQYTTHINNFKTTVFRICGVFSFTYNPSHYIEVSNVMPSELNDMDPVHAHPIRSSSSHMSTSVHL